MAEQPASTRSTWIFGSTSHPGSWVTDWDTLMGASEPNASTVGESFAQALSRGEAARFEQELRPLVDAGRGVRAWRRRM